VVCPVFESITVVKGRQLHVTVLAFSCLTTTQCSMSSAVGGGSWLRVGGGVTAPGCFFAAQPARSRQNTRPALLMSCFSLVRLGLSMAILVTPLPGLASSCYEFRNLGAVCSSRIRSNFSIAISSARTAMNSVGHIGIAHGSRGQKRPGG